MEKEENKQTSKQTRAWWYVSLNKMVSVQKEKVSVVFGIECEHHSSQCTQI